MTDVKKLGKKGDLVEVAEGYGRNYLLPRGLAMEASQGRVKELDQRKEAEARRKQKEKDEAKSLADRLAGLTVVVRTKTGEKGRLFGSVTNKEIAEALTRDHRITLDKKKIEIKAPIKELGVYPVTAKIYPEVQAQFKVEITG